jgi:PQQ-dependent catabolism-associated CXXCW motif protein
MTPLGGCVFVAALLLTMASVGATRADPPPEPEGYRTESYRAPTPATLKGGSVLSSAEAHALWESKAAVFIDVLPQAPRPKNLPKDVVWRDKPRYDIPGSVWLPDTGYGELSAPILGYFQQGLSNAAEGDAKRTLVFYCQRDCWMSWNSAKRALASGFAKVDWYPDGVDGWAEAGYPLEERTPAPRPP